MTHELQFSRIARAAVVVAAAGAFGFGFGAYPLAQGRGAGAAQPAGQGRGAAADTEVHTLKVQGNIYMLVGAGGNIAVSIGEDGVLLVDTGLAQNADKVIAAVRQLTDKPIRYIINTHAHPDHVGGNEKIGPLGGTIAGGNVGAGAGVGATIIAHEEVLNRMSAPTGQQAAFPTAAWPTDTYFVKKKEIFFNNEPIEIIHAPNAHTDGDSIVFFRRSDVIVSGDLFMTTTFPIIDHMRGGNFQGIIDSLNVMLDIAIPKEKQEGGTYIIPGHGRLCDEADLLEYRDMNTIIRDRVADMVKKGMSLDAVKKANPVIDYEGRYGAKSGFWTTDQFVEAVYQDMTANAKKK